jgi:hypothetical protein
VRARVRRASRLALALLLTGCGGGGGGADGPTPPVPPERRAAAITVASGNGQGGAPGAALAAHLCARVVDQNGAPFAGAAVAFAVGGGSATVAAPSATSGTDGLACTAVTLGATPGPVEIRATLTASSAAAPALFAATVTAPPAAATRIVVRTPPAAMTVASAPGAAPVACLADPSGTTVASAPATTITLTLAGTLAGQTTLAGATATTVDGCATFGALRLVGPAGPRRAIFGAPGLDSSAPVDFTLATGPAAAIRLVAGGGQAGAPGAALAQPVVVVVTDANAVAPLNVIAGVPVTFTPAAGSGSVAPATPVTTGADGRAQVTWTLGGATGGQSLVASAPGIAPSLTVAATAGGAGGAPARLAFAIGTPRPLILAPGASSTMRVEVSDANGAILTPPPPITWASRADGVITVASDGVVRGVARGGTILVATATGGSAPSDSTLVVVADVGQPVLRISNATSFDYTAGATITLGIALGTRSATDPRQLGAADLRLTFPPSLLTFVSGTIAGGASGFVHSPTPGTVAISLASAAGTGPLGPGVALASVTFTVGAAGQSGGIVLSAQSMTTTAVADLLPTLVSIGTIVNVR